MLFGGIFMMSWPGQNGNVDEFKFPTDFFYEVILPPIIFEAGWSLRNKHFFKNFRLIFLMATFGTFINWLMIAFTTIGMNNYHLIVTSDGSDLNLQTEELLLLSAMLCATDAVTVLTLLNPDKAPYVYGTVVGEGMLNDAVAIILFGAITNVKKSDSSGSDEGPLGNLDIQTIMLIVVEVLKNALISISIGVFVGLLAAAIISRLRELPSSPKEISILVLFAYISYTTAEVLQESGVISMFFCGIVMSNYVQKSVSTLSSISAGVVFKTASGLLECFLFTSLGFYVYQYTNLEHWSFSFFGMVLFVLCVGRFIMITVCLLMVNWCVIPEQRMGVKEAFVIWWSGLIRGAIPFSLSLRMKSANKEVLITTTFMIVIVTTLVVGSLTDTVMRSIGSLEIPEERRTTLDAAHVRGCCHRCFKRFDKKYMQRCFVRKRRPNMTQVQDEIYALIGNNHHQNYYAHDHDPLMPKATMTTLRNKSCIA